MAPQVQLVAVGSQSWDYMRQLKIRKQRRRVLLTALISLAGAIGFWLGL